MILLNMLKLLSLLTIKFQNLTLTNRSSVILFPVVSWLKRKIHLLKFLNSDADFLATCNIIDYSLLIGEILDDPEEIKSKIAFENDLNPHRGVYFTSSNVPYLLGVIDPLTGFK